MYEDFHVTDRWSGEDLHCRWKANIVAIATRHADAVDVRFDVNGRPMWIALPCTAWVEQKKRTGKVITDQLAAQIAGRYLKQLIEEGYDSRREIYTMTVPEVLEHLDAVVAEAKAKGGIPALPPASKPPPRQPGAQVPRIWDLRGIISVPCFLIPVSAFAFHSCRSASIGCTPAARRAGIQLAASATASNTKTPPTIVAGSHG